MSTPGSPEHMRRIAKLPRPKRKCVCLDRFAGLLAEGASPRDAAEAMGRPRAHGDMMLVRLRRKLGWQAR